MLDAGLIADAQRVEHYEISAYGSARTFATLLGEKEVVRLLEQTLKEEKAADDEAERRLRKASTLKQSRLNRARLP